MMQGQVSTWTEEQVEEKLAELCVEYRAVAILNDALNVKRKSIKLLGDDIANAFDHMKVPGTVIEKMDYAWVPALQAMRAISTTQWSKIELEDREKYTGLLKADAQKSGALFLPLNRFFSIIWNPMGTIVRTKSWMASINR